MGVATDVLLDEAVALQRAGQWSEAIDVCREVFRRSISDEAVGSMVEAVVRSGLCYRHMGKKDLAVEYLELGLTLANLQEDKGKASRALNGLATVYHMHGELDTAASYYREARALAHAAGDLRTCGNIDQNLGALANVRGDLGEAFSHYESALDAHRSIGNDLGVAGVLNNLGIIHISLAQLDKAAGYLSEALRISKATGDVVTEGLVYINQTELFLASGDLEHARTTCDEAYEILSRLGEQGNRSTALRFYGIIYREANKLYLAETHLREAIEVAFRHQYPLEEAEAQHELALVFRAQERNREALEALNRAHELFTALQAERYQADIAKRVDQLQDDFLALVQSWGESIEAKDRYTRGHCQRVADYACRIAEVAGIPERDMIWFRMGAFLHDVGKTEVPGKILNKAGRLTDVEREIIEQHTVKGDEILAPIPFPWDIRPMVRSHHERWDGRGYPDQLARENIPITARILRVADIFDALTTNRSYRQPLTIDQAFQIMQDDYGSFDPDIFEVFRTLLPEFAEMVPDDRDRTQTLPVAHDGSATALLTREGPPAE
jgi:putative nucleotidyltransferase with HDIG domain